jgi:hypothetical protein
MQAPLMGGQTNPGGQSDWVGLMKDGVAQASQYARRVTDHVHDPEAEYRSNMYCFIGGCMVVAKGAIGLLDVYNIGGETVYYILNAYSVFFGLLTMVMEIREEFAYGMHDAVHRFHIYITEWCHGITVPAGKVMFYLFQGTIALASSPYFTPGFIVGLYLYVMAAFCFCQYQKEKREEEERYQRFKEEEAQRGYAAGGQYNRGVGGIPTAGGAGSRNMYNNQAMPYLQVHK